jgi:hypothetical protein
VKTTEKTTPDLLSQLCDRQRDLTPRAHVALMEAFNRFVDLVPIPPLFCLSTGAGSVTELLERTALSVEQLGQGEVRLSRRLMYGEVQHLLALAAAES